MIISGGENIYAAEVEAIFREHAACRCGSDRLARRNVGGSWIDDRGTQPESYSNFGRTIAFLFRAFGEV